MFMRNKPTGLMNHRDKGAEKSNAVNKVKNREKKSCFKKNGRTSCLIAKLYDM